MYEGDSGGFLRRGRCQQAPRPPALAGAVGGVVQRRDDADVVPRSAGRGELSERFAERHGGAPVLAADQLVEAACDGDDTGGERDRARRARRPGTRIRPGARDACGSPGRTRPAAVPRERGTRRGSGAPRSAPLRRRRRAAARTVARRSPAPRAAPTAAPAGLTSAPRSRHAASRADRRRSIASAARERPHRPHRCEFRRGKATANARARGGAIRRAAAARRDAPRAACIPRDGFREHPERRRGIARSRDSGIPAPGIPATFGRFRANGLPTPPRNRSRPTSARAARPRANVVAERPPPQARSRAPP